MPLIIQSKGEIDVLSFTLLGNSTKRDQKGKIGRFGSGLKYSIARLLAMGIPFKVYSGDEQIQFSLSPATFRDKVFDVIEINGERTNFTTDMGPDWGAYDCIREIYTNAVDEGMLVFDPDADQIFLDEGTTTFIIEVTPEVGRVVRSFDSYFSFKREDAILDVETGSNTLKVFPSNGDHVRIFKDGFLVYENPDQKCLFHYDWSGADINESRVLRSWRNTTDAIGSILLKHGTPDFIERFKLSMSIHEFDPEVFEADWDWWTFSDPNENWAKSFEQSIFVTKDSLSFYREYVSGKKNVYVVPERLGNALKKASKSKLFGGGSDDRPNSFITIEPDASDREKVKNALEFLREAGIDIHWDIIFAKFEQESVIGTIDTETSSIVLSAHALATCSKNELIEIILEEHYHLSSGHGDKTRGFQNFLLKQIIANLTTIRALKNDLYSKSE